MKNTFIQKIAFVFTLAKIFAGGSFQLYVETCGENFIAGLSADSDAGVIETVMFEAPSYDGGDIRVLDQSGRRTLAFGKWTIARTEIGLPGLQRVNVSPDWQFAMIACDLVKQTENREAVEMWF